MMNGIIDGKQMNEKGPLPGGPFDMVGLTLD
jgi:hypothetical protein